MGEWCQRTGTMHRVPRESRRQPRARVQGNQHPQRVVVVTDVQKGSIEHAADDPHADGHRTRRQRVDFLYFVRVFEVLP